MFGRWFLRHVGRLLGMFWRSPDAGRAVLLLAGALALELGTVYASFLLSDTERRIMDALQDKDGSAFLAGLAFFGSVSAGFVLVAAYRMYVRQLVEIRWRRGETGAYLERWMTERAYLQMHLHGDEVDNPDQRIAEDIRDFVASALGLSLSLLAALTALVSFGGLLWRLSAHWVLPLESMTLHVPGLLLWVALAYATVSTWLTHVVGHRLVPLNVERLRYEADFRFALMHFRDNLEAVALSRGDALERRGALARFQRVVGNWWELIAAQRRLSLFTGIIGQANGIVPLLVAAPPFFAGAITLGIVAQIRFAYGQVSGALNWFVYAYQEIARWRANVERLATFTDVMDTTAADLERSKIRVVPIDAPVLQLTDLRLDGPDGEPLLDPVTATVMAGDRVAIVGPSGTGKTTLLRAIAGIWPFGAGRIEVPSRASLLFVPQRPYLPLGSLRAVISYPAAEDRFATERIAEALHLLGLDYLTARLDETAAWSQELSPCEQQCLAMARVLLNAPDWVFLDKATSALDEDKEKRAYGVLAAHLPSTTVVSVAHRPEVAAYHTRRWTIAPTAHGPSSLQAA